MVHVHGLGVNPGEGDLYIATHDGFFRLGADSRPQRVGGGYQDIMGFTVVGPDRFFGSGHPDPRDKSLRVTGKPPLLGLIESTDAGERWMALSLLGDADFHGLAYSHGRLYAWNASTTGFMVSDDLLTWSERSRVELLSFAVDTGQRSRIVGAGPNALLQSTDEGATWQSIVNAPAMALVASDPRGDLWGVKASGGLYHSVDGSVWERLGSVPGEPQALLATETVLYAAAQDDEGRTTIYESRDSGRTWRARYRDPRP